ncbi:hypothetical protein [Cryobacterium sp. MLB-32]|uniref:hypothetical protein n=1 Tax=Cryobacterium sp. MLB-32 TaxID=1529318 RepID=UPI00068F6583|nr:hypothetical protein [Cryobacterium sp. MLB-32]
MRGVQRDRGALFPLRSMVNTALVLAAVIVVSVAGVGGTYALLSTSATTESGATVTAGSSSLSVNGQTSFIAGDLSVNRLGPGASALLPLTLTNTGTTPLTVTASMNSVVSSHSAIALAGWLTVHLTPTAVGSGCTAGLTTGSSGGLPTFTTTTPYLLGVDESLAVCLEVALAFDAPSEVQGGAAAFTLLFDATQDPL